MKRLSIAVLILFLPLHAIAEPTVDEFMALSVEKQKRLLWEVGYHDGSVSNIEALKTYADVLHRKYPSPLDLKSASKDELDLLYELALADNSLAIFQDDKEAMLRGCKLGYALKYYLPLEQAYESQISCYSNFSGVTPEEAEEIRQLTMKGKEVMITRATKLNDSKKNMYLADSGRYLCDAGIDCDKGSKKMYQALLNEHIENNTSDFNADVLRLTGGLANYLIKKNIRAYMAYKELQYEIYKTDKLGGNDNNYYQTNEQRAEEFRPDAVNHPQLAAVLKDMDAGRSILEMEVERYRRDPENFTLEPAVDNP